jgi:hypothetical protein
VGSGWGRGWALSELAGEEALVDGVCRANTLLDQVNGVGGLVGAADDPVEEVPEGDAVGELLFGRAAEMVDNLAGLEAEPGEVFLKGVALLEQGLVDGPGEGADGTHGEEQRWAVPDPFEKGKELGQGWDGNWCFGVELRELARGDLESQAMIGAGVVDPVEVLDIFFASANLVGNKALPPVVSGGGCEGYITELVKEVSGVIKVSEGFGVPLNEDGFEIDIEPAGAVGLVNIV